MARISYLFVAVAISVLAGQSNCSPDEDSQGYGLLPDLVNTLEPLPLLGGLADGLLASADSGPTPDNPTPGEPVALRHKQPSLRVNNQRRQRTMVLNILDDLSQSSYLPSPASGLSPKSVRHKQKPIGPPMGLALVPQPQSPGAEDLAPIPVATSPEAVPPPVDDDSRAPPAEDPSPPVHVLPSFLAGSRMPGVSTIPLKKPAPKTKRDVVHEESSIPAILAIPSRPAIPSIPSRPAIPPIPSRPAIPSIPSRPAIPSIPSRSAIPTIPSRPAIPTIPSHPEIPSRPVIPSIPSHPAIPTIPSRPAIPSIPAIPAIPSIPAIPAIPSIPSIPSSSTSYPTFMGAMNTLRMLVANGLPLQRQIGSGPVSAEHIPAGPRPAPGASHPTSVVHPSSSASAHTKRSVPDGLVNGSPPLSPLRFGRLFSSFPSMSIPSLPSIPSFSPFSNLF